MSSSSSALPLADCWPLLRRYFDRHLQLLPAPYSSQDCNRVTIAHFAVCGLDAAMREMGEVLPEATCRRAVQWLYAQQVQGGFRGGPAAGGGAGEWQSAHLASTYSALVSLLTLGDELHGVARAALLRHIGSLQRTDGSVACEATEGAEADLRFVYCAVACLRLLGDGALSVLDVERLQQYVLRCQSYEGGFGLAPYCEAHGGATYLAVATLHIAGRLHSALAGGHRRRRLVHWCMARQGSGYTGRANKPVDSCYSFWLGAALQLLQCATLTSTSNNIAALLLCFDAQRGGFGKEAELMPDIMHSYLGTAGAAIIQHAVLQQQQPTPPLTKRAQQQTELRLARSPDDSHHEHGQPVERAMLSHSALSLRCLPFDVALGVRR